MHLTTRNVNSAFHTLVSMFSSNHNRAGTVRAHCDDGYHEIEVVRRPSRNGSVLVIDEPVTITYTHPRERVLFNQARDANPFALLYEALWMLAGRNDVESLAYYCKQFRDYSDDGQTLNGAYGYRWRHAAICVGTSDAGGSLWERTQDQLDLLVAHLKADPTSRRAVLAMWNVEDDLLKIGGGKPGYCDRCGHLKRTTLYSLGGGTYKCGTCGEFTWATAGSKDLCCNLSVMFSLREIPWKYPSETARKHSEEVTGTVPRRVLDMTVTNRSNDLVWGLLGANFVTFSVLQEYVAARLGAEVGRYHHFTNNLHVYDDPGNPKVAPWRPTEWLASEETQDRRTMDYSEQTLKIVPLVRDPEAFERELPRFVQHYANPDHITGDPFREWTEPFLATVAKPMVVAFLSHRRKCATTLDWAGRIAADDWRIATINWLNRRAKNHVS